MASHRPRAARLLTRLAEGTPSAEDVVEAIAIAAPYARTLARLAREKEMAEGNSEFLARAASFGVIRPMTTAPVEVAPATASPAAGVETPAAAESALPKKRRGRPPGSKNRPKEEQATKRCRRRS